MLSYQPKERRLFALIGIGIEREDFLDIADELMETMLEVAPEYLPPDSTDDPNLYEDWKEFVQEERTAHDRRTE